LLQISMKAFNISSIVAFHSFLMFLISILFLFYGCYHLVAPGRILHQHINHTASYQSCSTSHKNGFAMQTPQFQTFPEKARNIFLIW
jgi:hypothetical protein